MYCHYKFLLVGDKPVGCLQRPCKGKIPPSDVALKQRHRTADKVTSDTKMG